MDIWLQACMQARYSAIGQDTVHPGSPSVKGCETVGGEFCVFPFKYKGKVYSKCTKDGTNNGAFWCATAVDENQEAVHSKWADCGQGCPLDLENEKPGFCSFKT